MNTQSEEEGHIYLKTDRPIAVVGKAIAEEFSNWRYDETDNLIYQKEDGRKEVLISRLLILIFGLIMVFTYLPLGVGILCAVVLERMIYGKPKGLEDPVDFITIYEMNDSTDLYEPKLMTHVDFKLFDDNWNSNITEQDIANIRERL